MLKSQKMLYFCDWYFKAYTMEKSWIDEVEGVRIFHMFIKASDSLFLVLMTDTDDDSVYLSEIGKDNLFSFRISKPLK